MSKPQLYAVRIEAHSLPSGVCIPDSEYRVRAAEPIGAVRLAVRMAARDYLGLAQYWKPWLREIARHAQAVEVEEDMEPPRESSVIGGRRAA
jgi:hypothetical protein